MESRDAMQAGFVHRQENERYGSQAAAGIGPLAGGDQSGKSDYGENRSRLSINDLTQSGLKELRDLGVKYGINHEEMIAFKKQELIFYILKAHTGPRRHHLRLRFPSRYFPTATASCARPRTPTFPAPMIST